MANNKKYKLYIKFNYDRNLVFEFEDKKSLDFEFERLKSIKGDVSIILKDVIVNYSNVAYIEKREE